MNSKNFTLWNRLTATLVFVISAVTYLLTIEPTASFWDCGEFIASSYKLEVGHPPGNPVFQLFARFFTMFVDNMHAAVAVNALSAICSALTIFFLYLTIVFFVKRIFRPAEDGTYSLARAIAIYGSGAVGALAYCFSDTFWFSAVEGEVYAMSSLVTALVFWCMTKWYEQADQPYANRWIVLISFLMGLSIGIHLLNLLAIPALVFMFYYKQREDGHYSAKEYIKIFAISVVILAVILFGIIPYLPKIAAYFDLFFVNTLGLPFNSGAVFFMAALLGLCFWGLFRTMKAEKVFANTVLLCFTVIVIGFSLFSIVIIRSAAKTPTNEYQPDNPFTLVRYLGREQYGSNPLVYGQYFDAPYEIESTTYWAPMDGKYIKTEGPGEITYKASGKMLFPRMWNGSDPKYIAFYKAYMGENGGKKVAGATHKKPTFFQNLSFFFDFQMNWMYWRYFMWNFAGRQNDIHSPSPGDRFAGNWESGIPLIDFRLGDQSDAPDYMKNNKGKNHYYMLPLLLGLIGLFFQFARDKRGSWLNFLMFFMTGIAIVIYLNQPPYQVRERDYAYAGSFYFFSVWIGMAVAALYDWVSRKCKSADRKDKAVCEPTIAALVTAVCLGVPVLMAAENWDDHDRSNRYTAVEMARNYLNSVGENGILVTHGDNDTFPLWYAQEVENVRPDVRIANTSLLGTDWHIDQMKYAMNESAPLDLTVGPRQYLYGTNEFIYIYDTRDTALYLSDVMNIFKHPKAKIQLQSGKMVDYIMSRKFILPVNKENVLKYGILDEKYADMIPDEIVLTMPKDKDYLTKPELFMLDLLSNYQWDRPINFLSMGGDINVGIKEYLMYEGFSYKLVPIKNKTKSTDIGFADPEDLYNKMKNVYKWDALKRTDYFVDYQNFYTFCGVLSQRNMFVNAAKEMLKVDDAERAVELLDMCQECVPAENFPLDITYLGFSNEYMVLEMIETYFMAGADEKALELARRFEDELFVSTEFFLMNYDDLKREFDACYNCISYIAELADHFGYKDYGEEVRKRFNDLLGVEEE